MSENQQLYYPHISGFKYGGSSGNKEDDEKTPKRQITKKEIETAFFFLSGSTAKNKVLNTEDLKRSLACFFPKKDKEWKFLLNDKTLTLEQLEEIVMDNSLNSFDPVKEAFKIIDPSNTGFADLKRLTQILANHVGPLTQEDLEVVMKTCDVDGDGNIGVNDFEQLFEKAGAQVEEEKRKKEAAASQ